MQNAIILHKINSQQVQQSTHRFLCGQVLIWVCFKETTPPILFNFSNFEKKSYKIAKFDTKNLKTSLNKEY